jgi:4-hydroxybenzoate polyprenyltransferase
MLAPFRIVFDVAVYRLRKLEMANMFAAAAIMFALRLDWDDMAVRLGFGLLLNLLAYLTNDYCDVDQDLASPNKDQRKARYLKDHMGAALGAQIGLALVLAGIAVWWSPGLLVALVAGAGICWIYSWKLKRLPYVDVLAMISWGAAMPLTGFPLDVVLGWVLVGQLALFSACFESIQVIRDHDEDVASGVRTTAVRLGVPATQVLLRVFMVLSAAYASLLLHRWIGLFLLVSLFLPLKKERAGVYWNRQRMIMGLGWLAIIGWLWIFGESHGWLATIKATEVVEALRFLR